MSATREPTEKQVNRFIEGITDLGIYDDVKSICNRVGVMSLPLLIGSVRRKHIARARHEAMVYVRLRFDWSYPAIGDLFHRDHTTVISADRAVGGEDRERLQKMVNKAKGETNGHG